MIIEINLNGNTVDVILKNGDEIVDSETWPAGNELSTQLLPKIDSILKKNSLNAIDIENVSTHVSETSGITSARIVETIALAWNNAKNIS